MDPTNDVSSSTPSKSPAPNTVPIRLSKPTARQVRSIVTKCNRKNLGRRVKADDVIQKALVLLQDSHIEEIKSSTYSSQDQLEIEFKKYCQTHGNISKDAFLKLLLTRARPELSRPVHADPREIPGRAVGAGDNGDSGQSGVTVSPSADTKEQR